MRKKTHILVIDGEAHALELFKNEGLAPDAVQRVERFLKRPRA